MQATKFYLHSKLDNDCNLLINTLTGALDIVEEKVISYLNDMESTVISEDIRNQLESRGYIVSKGKDEEQLKKLYDIYKNVNEGISFIICPTYSCDLRCPYCFEDIKVRTNSKVLSVEEVDKAFAAIKVLYEAKGLKKGTVELYGGEPFQLSTREIVKYILSKARNDGFTLRAITNGTNLSHFEDVFEEYKDSFSDIQISLDGTKDYHDISRIRSDGTGTFEEIITNVNLLLGMGMRVSVRVNVGKNNVACLPELLKVFEENQWNSFENFICQFAPITDHFCTGRLPNWMPENDTLLKLYTLFDDFEVTRQKYKITLGTDMERRTSLIRSIWADIPKAKSFPVPNPCGAASRTFYAFGPDGYIYACLESVGNPDFAVGRYLPEFSLNPQKESMWERNVINIEKCSNCNIAPICAGGCMWSSLVTNGADFETPVCNYAHETIENFIYINKERVLGKLVEAK